ncbi:hypothetical protein [Undibacterium sp. Tian12W]|uniref:hypothetical protein n=1 Tax=Undibacterium sp. Tian12W TaxID=3413054 RepID=UPI003BF05313
MSQPLLRLDDKNTKCVSLMATIKLDNYLSLVEVAYRDQGGLAGQRAPIRTKTALKIRTRLIDDLKQGAVIPPVVLGVVCSTAAQRKMASIETSEELVNLLRSENEDISIIDGMQRTTALLEAFPGKLAAQSTRLIRVEIWVAQKVSSLIYRMLVLNTGQVPWDLKRQLDTLYRPIISEVQKKLKNIKVIGLDETNRRSQAGEYRSTRVVELFLAFTARSINIDIKEKVAEEFIKIDITEATASDDFLPLFIRTLKLMYEIDKQFDRIKQQSIPEIPTRVRNGKDIFTSAPGSIGFVVAVAEIIFGSPGFDYEVEEAEKNLRKIEKSSTSLMKFMKTLDDNSLADFLDLETLNQLLDVRSGRVGDHDRSLYKRAFLLMFTKSSSLISQGAMTPCWKAR